MSQEEGSIRSSRSTAQSNTGSSTFTPVTFTLQELRGLLLASMALTAASLELPLNYFDRYFTADKLTKAGWGRQHGVT